MKVVRHPRYADRMMRIEGVLAVAGVGAGTLLWTVAGHLNGYAFAAAAFLALGGINSGVKAMRNYNRYLRGTEGEDAVLSALQSLSDIHVCISNLVVPGTKQGDTDVILVGPYGVLVIEVKTYIGNYACHGDNWFRMHNGDTRLPLRNSVSRQLKRNIKAVQHYLIDSDVSAPVQGVIVFPGTTGLTISHPTVSVMHNAEIANHVRSLPASHEPVDSVRLVELFSPLSANRRRALVGVGDIPRAPG